MKILTFDKIKKQQKAVFLMCMLLLSSSMFAKKPIEWWHEIVGYISFHSDHSDFNRTNPSFSAFHDEEDVPDLITSINKNFFNLEEFGFLNLEAPPDDIPKDIAKSQFMLLQTRIFLFLQNHENHKQGLANFLGVVNRAIADLSDEKN